jgi:hypothetical protein
MRLFSGGSERDLTFWRGGIKVDCEAAGFGLCGG